MLEKLKKHKYSIACIAICLVAAFLRFFDLPNTVHFAGDEARDLFVIQEMLSKGEPILTGPQTTIGNFLLGPFFYYFITPSFILSGGAPWAAAAAVAMLDILTIILIFSFVKAKSGARAAVIASLLYATSFWVTQHARWSWNPNILPFFTVSALWLVTDVEKINKKFFGYAALGILVGCAIQAHAQAIWIVLTVFLFLLYKKRAISKIAIVTLFAALIQLPLAIYEIKTQGGNIKSIIGWVRETKETLPIAQRIFNSASEFFSLIAELLIGKSFGMLAIIILVLLATLVFKTRKRFQIHRAFVPHIILLTLVFCSFFLTAEKKYMHFLTAVFPTVYILIGVFLSAMMKKRAITTLVAWMCIAATVVVHISQLQTYYVKLINGEPQEKLDVAYKDLKRTVEFIGDDQEEKKIFVNEPDLVRAFQYISQDTNTKIVLVEDQAHFTIERAKENSEKQIGRLVVKEKKE